MKVIIKSTIKIIVVISVYETGKTVHEFIKGYRSYTPGQLNK
ncbi:hypothetical protein [Staphylococcus haemolyticus]|nr:hypothetical protein [Staphylococcus haemolyticus]